MIKVAEYKKGHLISCRFSSVFWYRRGGSAQELPLFLPLVFQKMPEEGDVVEFYTQGHL